TGLGRGELRQPVGADGLLARVLPPHRRQALRLFEVMIGVVEGVRRVLGGPGLPRVLEGRPRRRQVHGGRRTRRRTGRQGRDQTQTGEPPKNAHSAAESSTWAAGPCNMIQACGSRSRTARTATTPSCSTAWP